MEVLQIVFGTGLSFLFLAIVFVPMERVFPAKKNQAFFRKQWLLDVCFFFGQYLVWNSLVIFILYHVNAWIQGQLSLSYLQLVHQQPIWLQGLEVLVLSDLLIYWGHRLQHKVDFLWRFHKVHHTAEAMDWLAAHREHPIDSIYTVGIINLPAFLLGFDLEAITMIAVFRGLWAIYIHSNVRLDIGFLQKIIGSPALHHWHHELERDRGNYANISPLMDILFGTYVCPDHEPEHFGIKEEFPRNYLGQLVDPMMPGFVKKWFRKRKSSVENYPVMEQVILKE